MSSGAYRPVTREDPGSATPPAARVAGSGGAIIGCSGDAGSDLHQRQTAQSPYRHAVPGTTGRCWSGYSTPLLLVQSSVHGNTTGLEEQEHRDRWFSAFLDSPLAAGLAAASTSARLRGRHACGDDRFGVPVGARAGDHFGDDPAARRRDGPDRARDERSVAKPLARFGHRRMCKAVVPVAPGVAARERLLEQRNVAVVRGRLTGNQRCVRR